jgi:hypothetical protein
VRPTPARTSTAISAPPTPTAWSAEATLEKVQRNCSGGFTGVVPTLAQYRIAPLDADLRRTASR